MGAAASSGRNTSVLVGLVGAGIGLSRTPAMHEAAARALDIPFVYRLLDTDVMAARPTLEDLLLWSQRLGYTGLNVTFPYKQAILPLLDALSPEAEALGSVNTVLFAAGRRIGHNTDYWGFRRSFADAVAAPADVRVLLVGAGGAGVAVAKALVDLKVRSLAIHDIDAARARALAERLDSADCPVRAVEMVDAAALAGADAVVNATPAGMAKSPGAPFDATLLDRRHLVCDIVYFPLETTLLRSARAKGCRTVSGEGMAIQQAVKAFELFAGVSPDASVMTETFRSYDRQSPAA